MKPMSKTWPITLISLLFGGAVVFGLNALFSVPIEGYFAIAGILLFGAGLLFGAAGVFRSIATLTSRSLRSQTGIIVPVLTIAIGVTAWLLAVSTAILVKRSLDERAQYEQEHWDELYGATETVSQQGDAGSGQ